MMNTTRTPQVSISEPISPKILYFGTPVALITSLNELEAVVRNFFEIGCQDERVIGAVAVEVQVVQVHVAKELILSEHHIDPSRWRPLIYNFRHYYGLGASLGKTFRAEV